MGKKKKKIKGISEMRNADYAILGKSPMEILKGAKNTSTKKIVLTEKLIYIIYNLALIGLTDIQIRTAMSIHAFVWNKWKDTYHLYTVLDKARLEATGKVISAVYQAAVGFSHEETSVLANRIKQFDSFGKLESEHTEPLIVKTVKHYPPDMKAALKWLSVRYPDIWGDKQTLELKGELTVKNLDLSDYSDAELKMLEKAGITAMERKEKNIIEEAHIIQTSSN